MFNLVIKDLMILKKTLLYAVIYVIFAMFAFRYMEGGALSAATVGICYMLMIQACALDDKNGSEIMLNSLPLLRRDIVLAKYLSVFLYAVIAIVTFLLVQVMVSFLEIPIQTASVSLEGIIGAVLAMALLISIYFPIYFKLGFVRSRMIGMILFFSCFFIVPMLVGLAVHGLEGSASPALQSTVLFLQKAVVWLRALADYQIAGLLLALIVIITAISISLSLRFYANRDF